MSDDDDTPRLRPRRHQTATERDLEGIDARREREARRRTSPVGFPVSQLDELEDADAVPVRESDEIDTGITPRIADDDDLLRLFRKVEHTREESANRLLAAMGQVPPNQRLARIENRVRVMWIALTIVGTLAIGSIGAAGKLLYERGERDGTIELRLDYLERDVRDHLRDHRAIDRTKP